MIILFVFKIYSSVLISGVKQACCTFLEKQLDSTNCMGIKIFAEQHSCGNLLYAAESYSLKHFEEIVHHEEYKSLPLEEVERLINSDELQVCYFCQNLRFHSCCLITLGDILLKF